MVLKGLLMHWSTGAEIIAFLLRALVNSGITLPGPGEHWAVV